MDDAPFSDSIELQKLYKATLEISKTYDNAQIPSELFSILEIKGKKYLLSDGKFDVFVWQNDRWNNLYKGKFYGYNYGSKKFVFKNELYSFGGYGYWKEHGSLIKFMFNNGSWEPVQLGMDLPNIKCYVTESGLVGYLDENKYEIDIERKMVVISKYDGSAETKFIRRNDGTFDTKEYFIVASNNPDFAIIDKKNNEIMTSITSPIPCLVYPYGRSLIHFAGKEITKYDTSFSIMKRSSIEEGLAVCRPMKSRDNILGLGFKTTTLALIFISGILGLVFFRRRRKGNEKEIQIDSVLNLEFNSNTKVIQNLINSKSGPIINSDELDELFNISHIKVPESLRHKRSQMFININQIYESSHNKKLINRIKDPEDNRRYVYSIEP